MTAYLNLVKSSRLYPVLLLENFLSHRRRLWLLRWFKIILGLLALVLVMVFSGWSAVLPTSLLLVNLTTGAADQLAGLGLLLLALWLMIFMLDLYFRDYYYGSIITNQYRPEDRFTFTAGRILFAARHGDLLAALLRSATGQSILERCGISPAAADKFLLARRQIGSSALSLSGAKVWQLADLLTAVLETEGEFKQFLARAEITAADWLAAGAWVVKEIELRALAERWWSRRRLQAVRSWAADWAYGGAYQLERYARDLRQDPQALATGSPLAVWPEVDRLKNILLRSEEANALLVGPPGAGRRAILWRLAAEINSRQVPRLLLAKRLLFLNSNLLLAAAKDKNGLENLLLKLFNEAVRAGNIVLVIDDLAAFLRGAESLDVDLTALLDPYLANTALPVIALVETESYQRELIRRQSLLRRFEVLPIEQGSPDQLLLVLAEAVLALERRYPVKFTYPALAVLSQAAEQYFQTQSGLDQALDLLVEVVPWVLSRGERLVTKTLAWEFLKVKTAVPLGAVTPAEREKLLQLTDQLKRRVIGQTAALEAVSNALRRNRTAVRNSGRPIGSFLFLGPTGVGKTETAKALAATFFGSADALMRLDMSEYQSPEALEKLIGSAASQQPGILSSLLRRQSYGVLLLDEFEKTDYRARDLFLQIFDEGQFSDMAGYRLNARNLILIATSNAAAPQIWDLVRQGVDPATRREELIDTLVREGIFRPELLNRFDAVIIFHPLSQDDLRQVASLLLQRVVARLADQGVDLVVTPELLDAVVQGGANPVFGARPMLRFIQDQVEKILAERLLTGEIKSGSRVSFGADLALRVSH